MELRPPILLSHFLCPASEYLSNGIDGGAWRPVGTVAGDSQKSTHNRSRDEIINFKSSASELFVTRLASDLVLNVQCSNTCHTLALPSTNTIKCSLWSRLCFTKQLAFFA